MKLTDFIVLVPIYHWIISIIRMFILSRNYMTLYLTWGTILRKIYTCFFLLGITTGTWSTFLLCAAIHYYSHWPVGFYVSGGIQVLWATLWVLTVTDYPRQHLYISKEELEYLVNAIGNVFTIKVLLHIFN